MKNETFASIIRFVTLFNLASVLAVAGTWSGFLVDSGCFRSAEQNHNVSDSPVLKDVDMELRLCHPTVKTHSFTLVRPDGEAVALDSPGNTQAAQLVQQGLKSPWQVTVNGEKKKKAIAVSAVASSK